MRKNKMFKIIGLSVITAGLLVGCGGSSTTTSNTSNISGAVLKGPFDQSTITLYDAEGKEITSTTSTEG